MSRIQIAFMHGERGDHVAAAHHVRLATSLNPESELASLGLFHGDFGAALEPIEIESMWAVVADDGYRLDNIPFYARGYALGDIVSASPDDGGMLRCTGLVRASGHSTIRILCTATDRVPGIRADLSAMGCDSEADSPVLVAIDVPPTVPYAQVRAYLEEKLRLGEIDDYEEGCLGQ
jgi:hypothetical protein